MADALALPPLRQRAQEAQDRIGWTPYTNQGEVVSAVLDLARVVVEMAGRIQVLEAQVAALAAAAGGPG